MPPDCTTDDADASDPIRAAFAAVGWFVAFVGCLLAFTVVYYTLGVRYAIQEKLWFVAVLHAVVWLSAAALLAWPASRPVGIRRTLALRGCTLAQLVSAVLLAVALAPVIALAAGVGRNLGAEPPSTADALADPAQAWGWWALLLGSIFPPIADEIVFRGLIGRRLVLAFGGVGGVVATSLMFAATRVEPSAVAAAFVLGVALHVAFLATRSLIVPITMHAAANTLFAVADRLAFDRNYDLLGRGDNGLPAPALVFFGSIVVAAAAWSLAVARTRWQLPDGTEWHPTPLPAPVPPRSLGATPEAASPDWVPVTAAGVAAIGLLAVTVQVGNASQDFLAQRLQPSWKEQLARTYRQQGDGFRRDDRPADAIAAYTEALKWAPADGYAIGNRGIAHADLNDVAAAERDLVAATRLVPGEVQYWRYLGWSRMELGRYDESLDDLATVLQLVPDDEYALQRRGNAFVKLKRWHEAVNEYDRALRAAQPKDDDAADLHAQRGKALAELGHYEQAADDFAEALRRDPKHETAMYELAWLRAASPVDRLRDGKAAAAMARKLCGATGGRTAGNLSLLAAALMECGEAAEAVRTQTDALALATESERGFLEQALGLYRAGRPFRLSASSQ